MTSCHIQQQPSYRLHVRQPTYTPHPLLLFGIASIALHCLILAIPATPVTADSDRMQTESRLNVYLGNGHTQHHVPPSRTRHRARVVAKANTHQRHNRDMHAHKPTVSVRPVRQTQEWFHTAAVPSQTTAAEMPVQHQANATPAHDNPAPDPSAVALLLRQALIQHFHYPVIARQNAWQGKVVLNVRVEADGRVQSARVLQPSNYPILNRAARRAANAIGVIPAARPLLAGQSLSFRVPVAYQLQRE